LKKKNKLVNDENKTPKETITKKKKSKKTKAQWGTIYRKKQRMSILACGVCILQCAYWLGKRWVLRLVLNALSVDA
jgi:hypothetical protein